MFTDLLEIAYARHLSFGDSLSAMTCSALPHKVSRWQCHHTSFNGYQSILLSCILVTDVCRPRHGLEHHSVAILSSIIPMVLSQSSKCRWGRAHSSKGLSYTAYFRCERQRCGPSWAPFYVAFSGMLLTVRVKSGIDAHPVVCIK